MKPVFPLLVFLLSIQLFSQKIQYNGRIVQGSGGEYSTELRHSINTAGVQLRLQNSSFGGGVSLYGRNAFLSTESSDVLQWLSLSYDLNLGSMTSGKDNLGHYFEFDVTGSATIIGVRQSNVINSEVSSSYTGLGLHAPLSFLKNDIAIVAHAGGSLRYFENRNSFLEGVVIPYEATIYTLRPGAKLEITENEINQGNIDSIYEGNPDLFSVETVQRNFSPSEMIQNPKNNSASFYKLDVVSLPIRSGNLSFSFSLSNVKSSSTYDENMSLSYNGQGFKDQVTEDGTVRVPVNIYSNGFIEKRPVFESYFKRVDMNFSLGFLPKNGRVRFYLTGQHSRNRIEVKNLLFDKFRTLQWQVGVGAGIFLGRNR